MSYLSFGIRLAQTILLLAGIAAFAYGAWHLCQDAWYFFRGVEITGRVIGGIEKTEWRDAFPESSAGAPSSEMQSSQATLLYPRVLYRWPPGKGKLYRHLSSIWYEGSETDRFARGSTVPIRILPNSPEHARLPGAFTHYLWAGIAFAGGLFAIWILSSFFFLYEGMLGIESANGFSLFRSVGWSTLIGVLLVAVLISALIRQAVAPYAGWQELLSIAAGDQFHLPYLLAARGDPEPGRRLNRAERAWFNMPWLGEAIAGSALETVLAGRYEPLLARYAAAAEAPNPEFKPESARILGMAAEIGNTRLVKILLGRGMHPDTAFMAGSEPVRMAAKQDQEEIVRILLDAGARAGGTGRPLLADALEARAPRTARLILDRGATEFGWREADTQRTLTDLAMIAGMADIAALLERKGVPCTLPAFFRFAVAGDLNSFARVLPRSQWLSVEFEGSSILHLAVRYRQLPLARLLVESGADLNAITTGTDGSGRTPLIEAVLSGEAEMVCWLARRPGIDLNRRDPLQRPPLAHAFEQGRWDLGKILLESGANVNLQFGSEGNTPLHIAAAQGNRDQVVFLLQKGADPSTANYLGLTSADVCESGEILDLLNSRSKSIPAGK